MKLGKGFFNERDPEKIRILASCKKGDRLTVLFGESRQAIVYDDIVGQLILVESEHIQAEPSVFKESIFFTNDLIEQLLLSSDHGQTI